MTSATKLGKPTLVAARIALEEALGDRGAARMPAAAADAARPSRIAGGQRKDAALLAAPPVRASGNLPPSRMLHSQANPSMLDIRRVMEQCLANGDCHGIEAAGYRMLDEAFRQGDRAIFGQTMRVSSELSLRVSDTEARAALDRVRVIARLLSSDGEFGAPTLADTVLAKGVVSMEALQKSLGLPQRLAELPPALQGRCTLDAPECIALSLYSARESQPRCNTFGVVNAVMRADLGAAQDRLRFLLEPLFSGMAKLPALPNSELRRGLLVGRGGTPDIQAFERQHPKGAAVTMPGPSTGSRLAAYPGNVVLLMHSASEGTRLRDTSAFSSASAQREATFLPGTRFEVRNLETRTVPAEWQQADPIVASSGRRWADRKGAQVLLATLKELPEPAAATHTADHSDRPS